MSNPVTCSCENRKYLASITDDSAFICDEVIESYNNETNFHEKKLPVSMENFYILLAFLLIAIGLY